MLPELLPRESEIKWNTKPEGPDGTHIAWRHTVLCAIDQLRVHDPAHECLRQLRFKFWKFCCRRAGLKNIKKMNEHTTGSVQRAAISVAQCLSQLSRQSVPIGANPLQEQQYLPRGCDVGPCRKRQAWRPSSCSFYSLARNWWISKYISLGTSRWSDPFVRWPAHDSVGPLAEVQDTLNTPFATKSLVMNQRMPLFATAARSSLQTVGWIPVLKAIMACASTLPIWNAFATADKLSQSWRPND